MKILSGTSNLKLSKDISKKLKLKLGNIICQNNINIHTCLMTRNYHLVTNIYQRHSMTMGHLGKFLDFKCLAKSTKKGSQRSLYS